MAITRYFIGTEILVCKKCKTPVNGKRIGEYYSCDKCNTWTNQVQFQKQEIV